MKVTSDNYIPLKGFLGWMFDNVTAAGRAVPSHVHPLTVLAEFEAKSAAIARKSLQIGIGDTLENTMDLSSENMKVIDNALRDLDLPTLTTVRLEFSKKIAAIMAKARIRNDSEYYALHNVKEAMPDSEREAAWTILAEYENRKAGHGS